MSTTTLTPRHQSTGPRHRLGQAPDQHHAREIIHRVRTEKATTNIVPETPEADGRDMA